MTEHPILFSGPMVRALLAGWKTQTRRLVTVPWHKGQRTLPYSPYYDDWDGVLRIVDEYGDWHDFTDRVACPHGQPGDRLWVRETWRGADGWRPENGHLIEYRADERRVWREAPEEVLSYQFTGNKWRPSIHLPRWASRLDLELTAVRVERLQVISEEDARAEGVSDEAIAEHGSAREAFRVLWDSINGKRAPWASNPWVWVEGLAVAEGVR